METDKESPNFTSNRVERMKILKMVIDNWCQDVKTLTNLRLVSSEFQALIMASEDNGPMRKQLQFHVNGNSEWSYSCSAHNSIPRPISTLVHTTSPWAHIKFSKINMSQDFFGQPFLTSKFVQGPCLVSLKSLYLANVKCTMGQFIEFVARCKNLDEIRISSCVSLFKAGSEILKYHRFMGAFHQRLKELKHLTVIDGRASETVLTWPTLQGLTANMCQLVTLHLRVGENCTLPIVYVIKVMAQNEGTLRHVTLVGRCGFDVKVSNVMCRLKLQSLILCRIHFCGAIILKSLLVGQRDLELLQLHKMGISDTVFRTISKLPKLTKLVLDSLFVDGTVGQDLANCETLKEFRLLDGRNPARAEVWIPLFQSAPKFKLSTLHLRFDNACDLLQRTFLESLRSLVVIGTGDQDYFDLESIESGIRKVMNLIHLEQLVMMELPLCDAHFPPPVDLEGSAMEGSTFRSFQNLTKLHSLNLSRTEIGDDALTLHIIHLQSLEVLWIDHTRVTRDGIRSLVNRRAADPQVLKRIRLISARGCQDLRMDYKEINKVQKTLTTEFFCDVNNWEVDEDEDVVMVEEDLGDAKEEQVARGDITLSDVTKSYFS